MGLDTDYVAEKLDKEPFEILNMEQEEGSTTIVLTVVHELHPEQEFMVSLLSENEEGEDSMTLQFDGPDDFTDDEAKMILQQIMDTLVNIIEMNLDDNPEPADIPDAEDAEDGEQPNE